MRRIKPVLQLLLLLVVLYTLLRIWFWLAYFPKELSLSDGLKVFYWGLRLDLVAIIFVNVPLWLYLLFLDPFISNKETSARILLGLFLLINVPFLALNIIDLAYFN